MRLAENLDLEQAGPLQHSLHARILAGTDIVLDGSSVERVTTPCIQVLLSAALTCNQKKRRFCLQEPSPALQAALDDLHVQDFLTPLINDKPQG